MKFSTKFIDDIKNKIRKFSDIFLFFLDINSHNGLREKNDEWFNGF